MSDCGSDLEMRVRLKCELLENKDLKISPVGKKNRPEVLIGVSNIHRDYE